MVVSGGDFHDIGTANIQLAKPAQNGENFRTGRPAA